MTTAQSLAVIAVGAALLAAAAALYALRPAILAWAEARDPGE